MSDFRYWHETDMPKYLGDVRYWVNSGKHMLSLSFSDFDCRTLGLALRYKEYCIEWWYVTANLRDSGNASVEIAHDGRAAPSHHQIVRHMGNDRAPRMVRNDIEMVS